MFRDDRFRWLFCFAVTYLPEGLFLHTYVNTDSCCMLSTAMMVYALICVYQDGISLRNSLWMSGGIILCALSYYNAYGYIVSCILLFLLSFCRRRKTAAILRLEEYAEIRLSDRRSSSGGGSAGGSSAVISFWTEICWDWPPGKRWRSNMRWRVSIR